MSAVAHLTIEIRLRSPLCLARRPTASGQPAETLPYITGTSLRGGLAGVWLRGQHSGNLEVAEADAFAALFQSGAVAYGNCLPLAAGLETSVVPLTAWTEKHNGGWMTPAHPDTNGGSGVLDILKHLLCEQDLPDGFDRLNQAFAAAAPRAQDYRRLDVRRRQITRTAVESGRGTARERQLYSFEALETGQRFGGSIVGPRDLLEQLCAGVVKEQIILRLGQGRSRGMGEAQITLVGAPAPIERERAQAIADVRTFNTQVRELAVRCGARPAATDDELLLPVTLNSDVLLRDVYLLASSDPAPKATLGRYLALPDELREEMRPILQGCVQSIAWIGGWDEARGVPRPSQLATSMGSVWTFVVRERLLEAAVDWWLAAESAGLGERRSEGYGRVRLGHPLHLTEDLL
jgi:CRISPR-associated Csx10 family RAMP protein